ncbi:MAG: hypothetical protein WA655_01630, partial [Candidatus Korobacteraceae bacterium]
MAAHSTTELTHPASAPPAAPPRKSKLALLLFSLAFCLLLFLALDWCATFVTHRRAKAIAAANIPCRVADPALHHAMKPDCHFVEHWGHDTYDYFTNSLGFRDEKIRDVPLADDRPRILLLGDSFTEGESAWQNGYVSKIAAQLPQYDFLNAGGPSYSPSVHVNLVRRLLVKGVEFDEAIVFLGTFDAFNEAGLYRDVDGGATLVGPTHQRWNISRYAKLRFLIARNFMITNRLIESIERFAVGHGLYHLATDQWGDEFDMEPVAWTYRAVDDTDPHPAGYAPLRAEGGIAKEKAKMTLLWQELQERNIPISVVVYPYPSQLVHDSVESRQVTMWRDWCAGRCKRFVTLYPEFFAIKDQCPPTEPGCWYLSHF